MGSGAQSYLTLTLDRGDIASEGREQRRGPPLLAETIWDEFWIKNGIESTGDYSAGFSADFFRDPFHVPFSSG